MALKLKEKIVQTRWNGLGVPIVGEICELSLSGDKGVSYVVGEVIGYDRRLIVLKYQGSYYARHVRALSQILTEEEKFELARKEGIQQLMHDAGISSSAFADDPEAEEWAASAWDKGWRNTSTELPQEEEEPRAAED